MLAQEGKTRQELGRDEFTRRVWQWKSEKEGTILHQLRRMGLSLAWDRRLFTLDPGYSHAVTECFVRLHERNLVYRAPRLVHWCPRLQSVVSDVETIQHEQQGALLHVLDYGNGIHVATTRPETVYADVAVAVHPRDKRYAGIRECWNPLTGHRLPVVRDAELVDMTFGTGCVKVTPAHDAADRECGERHNLPLNVVAFGEDGRMLSETPFSGRDRIECRADVLKLLKNNGKLLRSEQHKMRVPMCSRTGDVLEPSWKPQWYVRCKDMAKRCLDHTDALIPEKFHGEWRNFLENSRDWCVSRQLWWGHRIPAYKVNGEWMVSRTAPGQYEVQDEDVLDTWFSSALFPLVSMGWPNKLDTRRYPISVMETGSDILFFWVARMMMICSEMEPQLGMPFKHVMLHPMVRDRTGRKMSKSVGNVIDPMSLIEGISLDRMIENVRNNDGKLSKSEVERSIKYMRNEFPNGLPKCGADSVRFALIDLDSGDSVNVDVDHVASVNHMCNKIWNAAKFVRSRPEVHNKPSELNGPAERWLQAQMDDLSNQCISGFASDKLYRCTKALKKFLLLFCDHYIEYCKVAPAASTEACNYYLHRALDLFLSHLHPFMPFLSGALLDAQRMSIPSQVKTIAWDADAEPFDAIIDVVSALRQVKTTRKKPFRVVVSTQERAVVNMSEQISAMSRVANVTVREEQTSSSDEGLVVPVRGNTRLSVYPREEDVSEEQEQFLQNKLQKLEEKLQKLDEKWTRADLSRVPQAARDNYNKVRQSIVAQIEDLKK